MRYPQGHAIEPASRRWRGGDASRQFDLCTDRDHDRREDRSLEQISWLAVLLWHVLDEQHERRDEQEQYLQLAQLREAVVACVEIKFLAARLRNRWIMASTPSTRHLLEGVEVSVPRRSTEPARPRSRRERT